MKTRKILAIAIIAIMFLALFIGTVSAITVSVFMITSGQYSDGNRMDFDAEVRELNVNDTLQLNTVIAYGDDRPGGSNSAGWTVVEADVEVLAWTSSDTTVATVSSTGLVTGKKAGTTTITATTKDPTPDGDPESIKRDTVEITVNPSTAQVDPVEDWTDFSNVTFNLEEYTRFNNITITFKNFTPKDGHKYTAFITQDSSFEWDESMTLPLNGTADIYHDENKSTYYVNFRDDNARRVVEEAKDAYLVVVETDNNTATYSKKMVLRPTKIEKGSIKANLGGGYLESFHVDLEKSQFYNTVVIADERGVTYKLGEVTDYSILNSIANEEAGAFTKLLAYAKADSNPLATGNFNFASGSYETANVARATGKISSDKYYYVYEVADTVSGKYVPVEDVVVFNGSLDGVLVHFAFAGSSSDTPFSGDENRTVNPTNVSGDTSIATKKIPQTGATPVFMIVLGSVVLVAGIFVVANKKYRDIK